MSWKRELQWARKPELNGKGESDFAPFDLRGSQARSRGGKGADQWKAASTQELLRKPQPQRRRRASPYHTESLYNYVHLLPIHRKPRHWETRKKSARVDRHSQHHRSEARQGTVHPPWRLQLQWSLVIVGSSLPSSFFEPPMPVRWLLEQRLVQYKSPAVKTHTQNLVDLKLARSPKRWVAAHCSPSGRMVHAPSEAAGRPNWGPETRRRSKLRRRMPKERFRLLRPRHAPWAAWSPSAWACRDPLS